MVLKNLGYGLLALLLIAALAVALALLLVPERLDRAMNPVLPHAPYSLSEEAARLHQSLLVADLHADPLLWQRDLGMRLERGQVDLPRLLEGNVALQVFTTVTRSPRGQNYRRNESDAADNITLLAVVQAWPPRTWTSLAERALYQGQQLDSLAARSGGRLVRILDQQDLAELRARRGRGESVVGALLGTEGSHALDGRLDNVDRLFEAGFRLMSLQHFFDNALGGSLHGTSGQGLTEFGGQVVQRINELGIVLDVSHSSEQVVRDVLALSSRPLVVSHSGFHGHCASPRNIPDELMREVAAGGGVIGVGYWDGAVCGEGPDQVVDAIRYGIDLVGVEHVALGSDFDGTVTTAFDTSELAVLTDTMLKRGFGRDEIAAVMGGNVFRLLAEQLPSRSTPAD